MKKKVIIIAEAGVNHNGDLHLAKKLIDIAADAKVDYVKFQTFKAENVVSKIAKKASYQITNTKNIEENQLQMLKKLELSHDQHNELIFYCKQKNISFFSNRFIPFVISSYKSRLDILQTLDISDTLNSSHCSI